MIAQNDIKMAALAYSKLEMKRLFLARVMNFLKC